MWKVIYMYVSSAFEPLLSLFVVIFHSHCLFFLSQFSSVAVFTLQVHVMRCVKCIHRLTTMLALIRILIQSCLDERYQIK